MKLYLPAIAALLIMCSGCTRPVPTTDAYLARMLANATYSRLGAELNTNRFVPEHDPRDIERLFDQNKARIVEAIAPYLRTYDGGEYPLASISAYGQPMPPDGAEVVFHISVRATIAQRQGHGIRPLLDDSYGGAIVFNVAEDRIVSTHLDGSHLLTVPTEELDRALALARQLDGRYDEVTLQDAKWLPRWYIAEYILTRRWAGGSLPGEYSFIRRRTKGHVLLLPFILYDEALPRREEAPYHVVSVDMAAGRVLGVYKGTIYIGPMYGE
jgi:hypothetical protein